MEAQARQRQPAIEIGGGGATRTVQRVLGLAPGSPYRWHVMGAFAVTLFLLLAGAALDAAGVTSSGGLFLFFTPVAAIVLLVYIAINRNFTRDMERLLAGDYVVHWRYDGDEWWDFAEAEWARTRQATRERATSKRTVALSLLGGLVVLGGLAAQDMANLWRGIGLLGFAGLAVARPALVSWLQYIRRDRLAGDVVIGPRGFWLGTRYVPLRGFGRDLAGTTIERGHPEVLRFSTTNSRTRNSSGYLPARRNTSDYRVPIPYGREAEANYVIRQIRHPR